MILLHPIMECAAADANGFGNLGFAEACLEVEIFGLLLLFCFHGFLFFGEQM